MIRVGFALEHQRNWIGGSNYFRNLLMAISLLSNRKLEPVIFVGRMADATKVNDIPACQIVLSKMVDRYSAYWWLRKITARVLSRDVFLERLLVKHNIDVLSHSGSLGRRAVIPSVCWVADFQHRRMPQFFNKSEIVLRDRTIGFWGRTCSAIIVSSHDAERDMLEQFQDCTARLAVLQFVSQVRVGEPREAHEEFWTKNKVPERYFLVANQFWAHKNHRVIIDALARLKSAGRSVSVVATGNPHDYRQPGFCERLMEYAKARDVLDEFKVLGVVSSAALAQLMTNAVAVINPSEFEGWNTAVEEAKSLGKNIILSDIPVHQEQNPDHARFFPVNDPIELASAMWDVWSHYEAETDKSNMKKAGDAFPARQQEFGRRYQEIILGVLRDRNKRAVHSL